MALLLAPYNDSMRLGMGFNSYTQTIAIDRAVEVTDEKTIRAENPSQIVTYSSRLVEHLSEVVSSMNISYSTSIKKGSVEAAGSGNAINEEKIKASDLNAVVSVKVVNQTTILTDNCVFKPLSGIEPGTTAFNDAFGDCYISGFIEGGDFYGIISIRVLDRSKTEKTTQEIKKRVTGGKAQEFSLDADLFSSGASTSEALKDTETTISVAWMGGGQIKDEQKQWDMDSVFATAAAFPAKVAKCPQRTWAILTKYKANRSFQSYAASKPYVSLEYDTVSSFTAELFENFMEYKSLIKLVQDISVNRDKYKAQVQKANAITTDISTLVAVKAAFRREMDKIVQVVDKLAKDPTSLSRSGSQSQPSTNPVVLSIIEAAVKSKSGARSAETTATTSNTTGPPTTATSATMATPASAPASTTSTQDQLKLDINSLIPPEVWSDLLPLRASDPTVAASTGVGTVEDFLSMLPPPPSTDSRAPTSSSGTAKMPGKLTNSTVTLSVDETSKIDTLQKTRPGIENNFQLSQAYGSETQGTYFNNLDLLQPDFVLQYIGVEISGGAVVAITTRYTNGLILTRGKSAGKPLTELQNIAPGEKIIGGSCQIGQMSSLPNQSRLLSLMLITNRGQTLQAQAADYRFTGAGTWQRDGVDFKKVENVTFRCPLIDGRLAGFWGRSDDLSTVGGTAGIWRLGLVWSDELSTPSNPKVPTSLLPVANPIVPESGSVGSDASSKTITSEVTTVPFTAAKPAVPRVISGVCVVNFGTTVPLRVKQSISEVTTSNFKWTSTYDNVKNNTWYNYMDWLCLPDNLATVQTGKAGFSSTTSNSVLLTINFPNSFNGMPEVFCWFTGVALEQPTARVRVRCIVKTIELSYCTIQVEALGGCVFQNAEVGWIAWDPAVEGLRIRGSILAYDPTNTNDEIIKPWPGGSFSQSPAAMGAISEIDVNCTHATDTQIVGCMFRNPSVPISKDNARCRLYLNRGTIERIAMTWVVIAK